MEETSSVRERRLLQFIHREIVRLTYLIIVAVVAFVGTRAFAMANARMRLRDADAWYASGQQLLRDGHPADAVASFRRAMTKAPDAPSMRLGLARALLAAGDTAAAEDMLVQLRDASPEDVDINLALARLTTARDEVPQATRYYQQALNNLWRASQRQPRLDVRREFIHVLLAHGERARADSEVLILSTDLPEDAASQIEAGRLLLAAGDARRALDRFRRALRLEPKNIVARIGARDAAEAMRRDVATVQEPQH